MKYLRLISIITAIFLISVGFYSYSILHPTIKENRTIYVIPVYGQSLALGEEAPIETNLDSLQQSYDNRILGPELNTRLGFFSSTIFKQRIKMLINDRRRQFETSCFTLAATLLDSLAAHGDTTSYVCTFEAGQGDSDIENLGPNSEAYNKLIRQLENIAKRAKEFNCKIIVPAFCWVQGENNLVWSKEINYTKLLRNFRSTLEKGINKIFDRNSSLPCILYQTSCLSIAKDGYHPYDFHCRQISIPEQQRQLIAKDSLFYASVPIYPFEIAREYVHLVAKGQQMLGRYEGRAISELLNRRTGKGLQLISESCHKDTIELSFKVPCNPLVIDTIQVMKAPQYGFSVITPNNENILKKVIVSEKTISLITKSNTKGLVKVRYGANGETYKSGCINGPRGNIRDSSKLPNWMYITELTCDMGLKE